MKRAVSFFGSLFLGVVVLQLAGSTAHAVDPTFTKGDVFVGVSGGNVQWRHADGSLVQTLTTHSGTGATTGMAFDSSGKLYVTNFDQNEVSAFNTDGTLASPSTFGTGYNSDPESMLFDKSGDAYVGQADGTQDVLKFDSTGNSLATYAPATGPRGTDWIDLAADQCTLYYTSEGTSIKRFNVCTNTQLVDFATGLTGSNAYALRIRPDGGLLVADSDAIRRLDANGNVAQTYDATGQDCWFALNLDPDGTSFWSADFCSSNVYKFDIATGNVLTSFSTGTPTNTVFGLAVSGEITVSQPQTDLSVDKTDSPDPVSSGGEIRYAVTATNHGPDDATGVTITDTLPAGTTFKPFPASSENCSADGGVVTCTIGSLSNGATSSPSYIVVTAPTVNTQTIITDTATVSGDQSDPNPTNNTDMETTTVKPSNTSDFAAGFYDGVNTLDIQTQFGSKDSMRSELIVPPATGDNPYQPSTVTDTEVPAKSKPKFCGGSVCDAQLDVSVLPTGSQPDTPIQVILYFKDDAFNGNAVYAQGDSQTSSNLLANCDTPSVARVGGVPSKCVSSITIIKVGPDKTKKVVVNVDSGSDPTISKK